MHWLEEQLHKLPAPDTVIHLGAGLCRELDHWRTSGARRIVLVEPNPELLPELLRRIRTSDPVAILPVAISAQAGREALRLFNFAMLSSLRAPTGLYQILPGLSQVGRVMIETITVEQLLDDLDLTAEGEHWLVIDTPGEEATILDQLQQSDRLHHFARIFLSAGIESLYEGAKSAPELLSQLQALGFEPAALADTTDTDWSRHHLRVDRMALECKRLKAELADHRKMAEHLTAELKAAKEQTTKHQTQLEKAQADLSLALRLQMLRENDLKELQTRYGEVLTIKDEQQDLLTQLHHRLSRAAEYLQLVHARADDKGLPEELLEALTGKDEKSA